MVIHDLVDHDIIVKVEAVGRAWRDPIGIEPLAVRREPTQPVGHRPCINDVLAVGRVEKNTLALNSRETKLCVRDRMQSPRWNCLVAKDMCAAGCAGDH